MAFKSRTLLLCLVLLVASCSRPTDDERTIREQGARKNTRSRRRSIPINAGRSQRERSASG